MRVAIEAARSNGGMNAASTWEEDCAWFSLGMGYSARAAAFPRATMAIVDVPCC